MSKKEKEQLVTEVNILRELKNDHIVRYIDRVILKEQQRIFIVMEYCKGGDMAQLIKHSKLKKAYIPEDLLWKIFAQIAHALHFCHTRDRKVLHRDLKPGNVFLDEQRNVKLGDFGLSRELGEESVFAKTHVGTPYYMSPEQMHDKGYNEKSDIWSLGCVIYEIASLSPPFKARNHAQLAEMIKKCKIPRLPSNFSNDLYDLICQMIQKDPNARPSAADLLNHHKIVEAAHQVNSKKSQKAEKKRKAMEEEYQR